jgi:fumarate hydratase class I
MPEPELLHLNLPLSEADVVALHAGESLLLSGVLLTGRDAAHKWLVETFIKGKGSAAREDLVTHDRISEILKDGAIYHCGPVVNKEANGVYRFVAAGPTTSIREEPYQAEVIRHFGLRAVIGKGGMGERTLQALSEQKAVYLHATGGAAALMAACVKEVLGVHKLDFGTPEAMWVIRVKDLPVVVSMDAHGNSLHEKIRAQSRRIYEELMGAPGATC